MDILTRCYLLGNNTTAPPAVKNIDTVGKSELGQETFITTDAVIKTIFKRNSEKSAIYRYHKNCAILYNVVKKL